MTAENNRKYIAEAWIENGKEEDFKKSFLNALIEQWQGHRDDSSGLNADRLDGQHLSYFEEKFDYILSNMIKTFKIGFQMIVPSEPDEIKQYKLGFEAIQLFLPGESGYSSEELELPWESRETPYAENEIPTLHDAFRLLYEKIQEVMVSKEQYNEEFYEPFYKEDGYISQLNKMSSALHNIDNEGNINAQTINGLRFYVVTQTQYDEYKRDYPEKVNNIHNIFIIKSEQELFDNGYENYIYDGNPDILTPDRYYRFRVMTLEKEEGKFEKWLQYCYDALPDDQANWIDMCKAEDFIDSDYIKSLVPPEIKNFIQNDTSYYINRTSLLETIDKIKNDDNNPIDIIGFSNFIKGAYYYDDNVKKDITRRQDSGKNFLDLTDFNTGIVNKINNVSTALNQYKKRLEGDDQQSGVIGTIRGDVSQNASSIGGLNGRVSTIEGLLQNINNNITEIQKDINNITKTEYRRIEGLRRPKDSSDGSISKKIRESYLLKGKKLPSNIDTVAKNGWLVSSVRYNRELRLATIYISFYHYHLAKNQNKWVEPSYQYGKNYKPWRELASTFYGTAYKDALVPQDLLPTSTVLFNGPNEKRFIKIAPEDGKLYVLSTHPKDVHLNFFGQVTYRMQNSTEPADDGDNE